MFPHAYVIVWLFHSLAYHTLQTNRVLCFGSGRPLGPCVKGWFSGDGASLGNSAVEGQQEGRPLKHTTPVRPWSTQKSMPSLTPSDPIMRYHHAEPSHHQLKSLHLLAKRNVVIYVSGKSWFKRCVAQNKSAVCEKEWIQRQMHSSYKHRSMYAMLVKNVSWEFLWTGTQNLHWLATQPRPEYFLPPTC